MNYFDPWQNKVRVTERKIFLVHMGNNFYVFHARESIIPVVCRA